MALATSILATSRRLYYEVRINSVLITPGTFVTPDSEDIPAIGAIKVAKSFAAPVPVCTLTMNRMAGWIKRGMEVTVDVGYDAEVARLFTGYVQDRHRGVGAGDVVCLGKLWSAFRTIQIPPRTYTQGAGTTVEEAIEAVLDYVNILDRSLTIPAFTLATAQEVSLSRMPAYIMLETLMDIDGCRVSELGSGQAVIRVLDELPSTTAFKKYSTDDAATSRILASPTDREDPGYFRDRVTVTGATIIEGTAPDTTSRTLTATATLSGSKPLIQPPLPVTSFIDAEHENHLVDTDVKLTAMAARLLRKYARVPRQMTVPLAGDPLLELGQTINLAIPELDLNENVFISGIEHVIDGNGYVTKLTDVRGAGTTGGTIKQNPIACFTFRSEREVYGAGVAVVATLDASCSFDPDGSIVSYAWSDNQLTDDPADIATETSAKVTIRADTSLWTGDWLVTLTVTDDDGLTHSVTLNVPYDNDEAAVVVPTIYVAMGNQFSASPDGGVNWNDETTNGSGTVKVAAMQPDGERAGIAVFGQTDGQIYRTDDYCATDLTLVTTLDAEVADLQWDWRTQGRVWALDTGMKLYLSSDYGVNWGEIVDFAAAFGEASAIGKSIGLPAAGGVWVWGGDGTGNPMFGWFFNQTITRGTLGGQLADDSPGSNPNAAIVDAADHGQGLGLILENYDASDSGLRPVYFADNGLTPASWRRITGLPGGFSTDGIFITTGIEPTTFHFAFADRDISHVTARPALSGTTADVLPAGFTPNACLPMGDVYNGLATARAYLIGAEDAGNTGAVYKSSDELESVGDFRPAGGIIGTTWPGSADGKDIAVGAPAQEAGGADRLVMIQSPTDVTSPAVYKRKTTQLIDGAWTLKEHGASNNQFHVNILKRLGGNLYRITADHGNSFTFVRQATGQLQRSNDGGVTWLPVGPTPLDNGDHWGVTDIDIAPDGTLWLCAGPVTEGADADYRSIVQKSTPDSDGLLWSTVLTDAAAKEGVIFDQYTGIACHPFNPDIVAVVANSGNGNGRLLHTLDGGDNFTRSTRSWSQVSAAGRRVFVWDNGRVLMPVCGISDAGYVTDDFNATTPSESGLAAALNHGQFIFDFAGTPYGLMFVLGGSSLNPQVVRTRDYAENWEEIFGGGTDFVNNFGLMTGLAYDSARDILYMVSTASTSNSGLRPRVRALDRASEVQASNVGSQTWRNLQLNLDTVFDTKIGHAGIAVLP